MKNTAQRSNLDQIFLMLLVNNIAIDCTKIILDNPRMSFRHLRRHPLLRPDHHQLRNKVPQLRTKVRRTLIIHLSNPLHQIPLVNGVLEWRLARIQLKCQYPQTPQVESVVIVFLIGDFRADVVRSAAIGSSTFGLVTDVDGPTKIRKFDLIVNRQQYILRLDIPMNDILLMQILQPLYHLIYHLRRLLLLKPLLLLQQLIQLAVGCVFHDDIDLSLIVEVTVHLEDVGVLQVAVDLDLAPQLEDYVAVDDLLL